MKASEVPPHIAERYGLGRTPWWTIAIATVVVVAFAGALTWATLHVTRTSIEAKLLIWQVRSDTHTNVIFEVRKAPTEQAVCVMRAQDSQHVDVAYAEIPIPTGTDYSQIVYELRTIAPSFTVEILGCGDGGPPDRIQGPQFPAGVLPPEQPWTPSS